MIPKKIIYLIIISFAILAIISTLVFYNISQFLNANNGTTRTYQVLNQLERVNSNLKDSEAGARGYLLNGKEYFLEPYYNAIKILPSDLANLKTLISDNKVQINRLEALELLINSKLKIMQEQVNNKKTGNINSVKILEALEAGKNKMDEIRAAISEMREVESNLLVQAISEREVWTFAIYIVTGILIVILTGAIIAAIILLKKESETNKKMEESLKQGLDYSNKIIDTVPTPLIVLDPQLKIINVNRSFYNFFGYTKEEIEHRSIFDILKAKYEDNGLKILLSSIIPENTSFKEFELELIDNKYIQINAARLYSELTNGHMILTGIEDITDKKKIDLERLEILKQVKTTLSETQAAKSHFVSLFESAPGLYLVLTPDEYYIDAVSEAYLKATMRRREEIIDKKLFDIFPDDPNQPEADGVRNLSASLERVKKDKRADVMGIQHYPIKKPLSEGEAFEDRYWSPINSPVFDEKGELAFIIHRVEDVTEYIRLKQKEGKAKEAQQALNAMQQHMEAEIVLRSQELIHLNNELRALHQEMQEVQRIANIGSWSYDVEAEKLVLSEQGLNIFSIPIEKTITESPIWFRIVQPEDEVRVAKVIKRALASGDAKNLEHKIRDKDTARVICTWSELAADSKGQPKRITGLFQDITERKKIEEQLKTLFTELENSYKEINESNIKLNELNEKLNESNERLQTYSAELEEANETKDKLFSIIAHDLRSPFQVLTSVAKILIEDLESFNKERIIEIANELRNTVKVQYEVVDSLLSWVQMQRGRVEFNPRRLFVYDKVKRVTEQLKIHAENKKVKIDNLVPSKLTVIGDMDMLQTVFQNLIYNAIKYCNQDNGRIEINATNAGEEVIISVSDNGIGMDKELQKKMFTIDVNIKRAGTNNEKGTGLGMNLSKEMIEKQGGRIWVESEEGKGTTFYFTLPGAADEQV